MSTANVLVALNSSQVGNFYDNFRFDAAVDEDGHTVYVRKRIDFATFVTDNAERPVTLDPYNRNHLNVHELSEGMWKPYVQGGPVTTIMTSFNCITHENDDGKISMVEYLRAFFPGRFQIMGVWYSGIEPQFVTSDGEVIEYGQTITRATYDDADPPNELTPETVDGNGAYPLLPEATYLNWMPDDPIVDENGEVIGSTPATTFKQVFQTSGFPPRRAA